MINKCGSHSSGKDPLSKLTKFIEVTWKENSELIIESLSICKFELDPLIPEPAGRLADISVQED